jgi:hypothetical protein
MTEGLISEEVRAFIAEHIQSVEQLEVLLLLHADPTKEWSAEAVSQEIRSDPVSVAHRLTDLYSRGLLTVKEGFRLLYRYSPHTKQMERTVTALAQAYTLHRIKVIDLIYSGPRNKLLLFADAFKLKKDG